MYLSRALNASGFHFYDQKEKRAIFEIPSEFFELVWKLRG
jgi:hypothetical protein